VPGIAVLAPLLLMAGRRPTDLLSSTDYRAMRDFEPLLSDFEANHLIFSAISEKRPFMAGKIGSTELRSLVRFQAYESRDWLERIWSNLSRLEPVWRNASNFRRLKTHSGVFPISSESLLQFFLELQTALEQLDLLASWVPGENKIFEGKRLSVSTLRGIEPFFQPKPWTLALTGQRVLVVHPFRDTITLQWQKRRHLFDRPSVLPDFDLQIVKAPQTLGGFSEEFQSWSKALEYTNELIAQRSFDVALVGCGSYSLPIARRIKEMGRPVVVMGGQLQLLFGIKGKRWDGSRLYKESWIRPLRSDKPPGFRGADGGAYW